VLEEFDTMALRTLEGQATELGWRRDGVTAVALNLGNGRTADFTTTELAR